MTASFSAMLGGCKSDPAARTSQKGEECQTTADCTAPLSCVPTMGGGGGGVCVTGVFHVAAIAKECAIIACSQPVDCCPTMPTLPAGTTCATLASDCTQQGPGSFACTEQKQYCTPCDDSKYSCDNGACHSHCSTDPDCNFGSTTGPYKCNSGQCVICTDDSECASGDTCNTDIGQCVPPCQGDGDCPGFQRCQDSKCTASGCKTDRECVAATHNVEAKCGKDTKCTVPCQTDLECGNPKEYSFYSCINSTCTFTGCESDKQCELYLTGGSDASTPFGSKQHITCRDMAK
ncbi:MAG: hypothetical protein ABIP89_07595 [Polyangiaceae bacterium]